MNIQKTPSLYRHTYAAKIIFIILLILFFFRMVILQGMVLLQGEVSRSVEIIHTCIANGLISIVIWLNREDLQSLNIDRKFIIIFIFVGYLYSLLLPLELGIFLAPATTLILWLLLSNKLQFAHTPLHFKQVAVFILIILVPLIIKSISLGTSATLPDAKTIIEGFFTANLPLVVFEEVLFRGLLWMHLISMGFQRYQVIFTQGLLFWFSHLYYFKSDPISFWFWLPLSSIMLGIIVWRSKSISQSTIGHFLYNFLLQLVR
jgi:hypothetical protein